MKTWFRTANLFLNSWPGRQLTLAIAKAQKPKMWSVINIEGYNICNLRCKMCSYMNMTRPKERMSLDLFRHIIDNAVDVGIKEINLNLYNEPLLDNLLFDRIHYAKAKGISTQFFSNGTLLNEGNISDILQEGVDKIYFSFNGATKQTYELVNQGGNFEITRGGITHLIEERNKQNLTHPIIVIVMVIQKDNYQEIEDFKALWGNLANATDYWPVDNREDSGLLPGRLDTVWSKMPLPCGRISSALNIISNGKAVLCCLDCNGRGIIGDLTKQTISDIWNSTEFGRIRKLHLEGKGDLIDICTKCDGLHTSGLYWWGKLLPPNIHRFTLEIYQKQLSNQ